jgi:hypothetical protein
MFTALTPDSPSDTVPESVPPVKLVVKFPGTVREGGVTSPPQTGVIDILRLTSGDPIEVVSTTSISLLAQLNDITFVGFPTVTVQSASRSDSAVTKSDCNHDKSPVANVYP